jgi:purine-nucleoside/S-methyl-5'-thioadenosine phosphorylase / adenosine deaminase
MAVAGILVARILRDYPHGFTTREGGASRGPFASLNLSSGVGDDPDVVQENWARLGAATGLSFARVRQVHGRRVVEAAGGTDPVEEADAVTSALAGVAACVSVADCVPVLLADPRSGAVAAVHAGWRGTIEGAAAAGVEALATRHGARPGEILAAIGPGIGPCCFEVSRDLAARFRDEVGPVTATPRDHGSRVDLWRANEILLRRAGVAARRIETLGRCTSCEERTFFSHRRDRGLTGRHVAFISAVS